jgi:hypothetical protein
MASIRKRADKWQVQIRRAGNRPLSKTFTVRKAILAKLEGKGATIQKSPQKASQALLGVLRDKEKAGIG